MTVSVCTAKWSNVRTVLALRTMPGTRLVRPQVLLMERAPVVPARALLPWVFEVVLPKDLVPLTGFKARVQVFHGRVLRMQANPEVLRTVLALRTMPGARSVRPKDLLMEQGPVVPARIQVFHGRVLRAVLALRTMPGGRLVPQKDLLMEQGSILARDLLAQALATRGIRSKVSEKGRSSDQVYGESTFENPYPLIRSILRLLSFGAFCCISLARFPFDPEFM